MYLLYADESGAIKDPAQPFFILAGIAVFETQTHWVEQDLITISKRFCENDPFAIELHGSPMHAAKKEWRGISPALRLQAVCDSLDLCIKYKIRLFASIIDKRKASGINILERSFEQLASRFDMFLSRCYASSNKQRGIMILDKSSTEIQIQTLARSFKYSGHSYGKLRNFSEVPLFIDSKVSKLMQLADLVSFAIKRHYADNDSLLYDRIKDCFDHEGGVVHGRYDTLI
ncbi:hypothetical protein FACS1894103_0340 [Campylobacterota bacterium]|nr:hypothetical protein FACS1894103_0340 [Campylobacterota bacterium]